MLILHIVWGEDFTENRCPKYLLTNAFIGDVSLSHIIFPYMQSTPWCITQTSLTPPSAGRQPSAVEPFWNCFNRIKLRDPGSHLLPGTALPQWLVDMGSLFPLTKENSDHSVTPQPSMWLTPWLGLNHGSISLFACFTCIPYFLPRWSYEHSLTSVLWPNYHLRVPGTQPEPYTHTGPQFITHNAQRSGTQKLLIMNLVSTLIWEKNMMHISRRPFIVMTYPAQFH